MVLARFTWLASHLWESFLILTILENKKRRISLWKSSVLALVYHGLDRIEDDDYAIGIKMEQMAEGVDVQLQLSDPNGRLMLQQQGY